MPWSRGWTVEYWPTGSAFAATVARNNLACLNFRRSSKTRSRPVKPASTPFAHAAHQHIDRGSIVCNAGTPLWVARTGPGKTDAVSHDNLRSPLRPPANRLLPKLLSGLVGEVAPLSPTRPRHLDSLRRTLSRSRSLPACLRSFLQSPGGQPLQPHAHRRTAFVCLPCSPGG